MQKDEFIYLLLNPHHLKETDYRTFSGIIDEYPLFSCARIMQIIAAKKESPEIFKKVVAKNAPYLNNLKYLQKYLSSFPAHPSQEMHPVTVKENTTIPEELVWRMSVKEDVRESSDLLDFNYKTRTVENTGSIRNKKDELIDKFINGAHGSIRAEQTPREPLDISQESTMEHDSLITDTLAKIYVKQGLYTKAIYAYEKLILKYPIKSSYFATQIEEIKKLINK